MTETCIDEASLKYQQKLEAESRPLFQAMLALPQSPQQTAIEFERFIKAQYGKDKPITRRYLDLWAGRYGEIKPLPKWLFSAAIDYLLAHGVNALALIPAQKVAEHWARARVIQMTTEEAKQLFVNQFQPDTLIVSSIEEAIEYIYKKPASPF